MTETGSSAYQTVPNWYVGFTLDLDDLPGRVHAGTGARGERHVANVTGQVAANGCRSASTSSRPASPSGRRRRPSAPPTRRWRTPRQLTLAEGRYEQGRQRHRARRRAGRLHERRSPGGAGALQPRAAPARSCLRRWERDDRVGAPQVAGGRFRPRRPSRSPSSRGGGGRMTGRAPPAGGRGAGDRPVPVLVATAETRDVPIYLEGLGTVTAYKTVTSARRSTAGSIAWLFNEGQAVKRGDLLAQIDPRPFDDPAAPGRGGAGARRRRSCGRAAEPRALRGARRPAA